MDSDDLPLNVSRETLQNSPLLRTIKKKLLAKALEMIKNLMDDEEKYVKFFKEYSVSIKMGILEDSKNAPKLIKLLRFHTSRSDKLTSIDEYVKNMKEGQKQIYFIIGESVKALSTSPFVENLLKKGYEILVSLI